MSIRDYFDAQRLDMPALSLWLNGLSHAERLAAVRALSGKDQKRLFEAAGGFKPLTLKDLVPEDRGALEPVIHHGKNSLPLFSDFQKRFCRAGAGAHELWGYNEQAMRWATGPGYFVTTEGPDGELLVDYTKTPGGKAAGWPDIKSNRRGISFFVFNNLLDRLRGVSKHVTIGIATKGGKPMGQYFVLCREDA